MIARTDPSKSPPSLLGNLVYLSAAYFPAWTGLVLIFYPLTMFEFMPGNVRERIPQLVRSRFFLAFKGVNLLYGPFAASPISSLISKFRKSDYPQPVQNN